MDTIAIWIVVYLLSGEPYAFTAIVPQDQACNEQLALDLARAKQAQIGAVQDEVLWLCKPVPHKDAAEPIDRPDGPPARLRDSSLPKSFAGVIVLSAVIGLFSAVMVLGQ